jgi:hypothetical protein
MSARIVRSLVLTVTLIGVLAQAARSDDAAIALVDRAHAAMGGAKLDALIVVRTRGWQRRSMLEQSIRPDGPYYDDQMTFDQTLDRRSGSIYRDLGHVGYGASDWFLHQVEPTREVVDGTIDAPRSSYDGTPARPSAKFAQELEEEAALGSLGICATARAASDLHMVPDRTVNGFPHPAVSFSWHGHVVELIVNRGDGLPTEVRFTAARPFDTYWNVWGDVIERIRFEAWNRESGGFRYPRQITIERNGMPETTRMITAIDALPEFPAGLVVASAPAPRRAIDDIPFGNGQPQPVAISPSIVLVPGSWNVAFVRTGRGIILVEMPISGPYVDGAIAYAAKAFPGEPVIAVVTTSDSWPHVGGLRAVVARGLPIYGFGLTRLLLDRMVRAPHRERPDALARSPRAMVFRPVDRRITVGSGATRIELIPFATATGERQLMLWQPATHALYTSDLFVYLPNATYTPETLDEAVAAVTREHLDPATAWGMHYGPTPWSTIAGAAERLGDGE